jgi:hypothetical protein
MNHAKKLTEKLDAPKNNLFELPDEIMLNVLTFVRDYDLQALSKVSRKTLNLCKDTVLWKINQHKSAFLMSTKLFNERRPNRSELIEHNILKGVQKHQIASGTYISSEQIKIHEIGLRLQRLMRVESLEKNLLRRAHSR